jgi:hypothetical protein
MDNGDSVALHKSAEACTSSENPESPPTKIAQKTILKKSFSISLSPLTSSNPHSPNHYKRN